MVPAEVRRLPKMLVHLLVLKMHLLQLLVESCSRSRRVRLVPRRTCLLGLPMVNIHLLKSVRLLMVMRLGLLHLFRNVCLRSPSSSVSAGPPAAHHHSRSWHRQVSHEHDGVKSQR
eukprot:g2103.t1